MSGEPPDGEGILENKVFPDGESIIRDERTVCRSWSGPLERVVLYLSGDSFEETIS